jgi:hypothetical protein
VVQPAASDIPGDVRINWRIAVAIAGALAVLFTIQNTLTPVGQRANDSVARTFGSR